MMTDSSMIQSLRSALLVPLALTLLACGQPPPPGSDEAGTESSDTATETSAETSTDTSATETGTDTGTVEETLYPLVDGASWTYVITNTSGQILGMDTIDLSETVWMGGQAWEMVDSPNANGTWSTSTIIRDGDLALRVHRVEMAQATTTAIIDYAPGFARASDAWTTQGFIEELLYTRTAYDSNGQNPVVEDRGHTFEVVGVDQSVTVPAGTFNCVKVERVRTLGTEAGALAWFWYAPGIGKVREERPVEMEIEELVSVSIPGGANLP